MRNQRLGVHLSLSMFHWALDAALIGRMAERGEGIITKDYGQVMGRIGCMLERRGWTWWRGSWMGDVIRVLKTY